METKKTVERDRPAAKTPRKHGNELRTAILKTVAKVKRLHLTLNPFSSMANTFTPTKCTRVTF